MAAAVVFVTRLLCWRLLVCGWSGRIFLGLPFQEVFTRLTVLDAAQNLVDGGVRRCQRELFPGRSALFERATGSRVEEHGEWGLEACPAFQDVPAVRVLAAPGMTIRVIDKAVVSLKLTLALEGFTRLRKLCRYAPLIFARRCRLCRR